MNRVSLKTRAARRGRSYALLLALLCSLLGGCASFSQGARQPSPSLAPSATAAQPGATATPGAEASATPTPGLAPADGCLPGEQAEMVWPALSALEPASVRPGEQIRVIGSGGFVRCGASGYNESARDFALSFDGAPAGTISCYIHHCEGKLVVPESTAGAHKISVEGGSELSLEVLAR